MSGELRDGGGAAGVTMSSSQRQLSAPDVNKQLCPGASSDRGREVAGTSAGSLAGCHQPQQSRVRRMETRTRITTMTIKTGSWVIFAIRVKNIVMDIMEVVNELTCFPPWSQVAY